MGCSGGGIEVSNLWYTSYRGGLTPIEHVYIVDSVQRSDYFQFDDQSHISV